MGGAAVAAVGAEGAAAAAGFGSGSGSCGAMMLDRSMAGGGRWFQVLTQAQKADTAATVSHAAALECAVSSCSIRCWRRSVGGEGEHARARMNW